MFKTILLAVDLNDDKGATKAAKAAERLALHEESDLHVLNVVPDMGYAIVGSAFGPDYDKKIRAEAAASLEDWVGKTLDISAETHVATGTIYDQIIRFANSIDADAIVVGAHSPELRDYLVGPNAARVVRHARQSVFVIR
ncbi:universal stress protein [Cognatishimia sp. F0-27]|uniref:universal stress protein n=1 Tax=Cognatishimia sp. F0-27 TaxID=2816855 RepID=UPI001D0CBB07|nr:universal stress protein [Cognatishimia sp. F0-27]MCC1492069.1 universal stress protein [Cognatishimia sp. F0-27]